MDHIKKLRAIQEYSGKSQSELAIVLGVSFPAFNAWINGKSKPRAKKEEKINELYISYVGDKSISSNKVDQQQEILQRLKTKYKNPFSLIYSRKDLYDSFLLAMTYNTNAIEGSTFNEPEVRAVLFDDITIVNKSVREHQEVKNHQGALAIVMNFLKNDNGKITEKFIKKIHSVLMNGIMHNGGQYRTHGVRIVGSGVVTVNYMSIEKSMKIFVNNLNKKPKDIVIHIAKTHSDFEKIHPFSDGNGRVGRLLMCILAFKYNLMAPVVQKGKKIAYYKYLEESQLYNNDMLLVSFMYDSLSEGYKLLKD
ncbi:Fic family protein [Candidatus Nomurabacteria bacterium]|nr:Fic family protein [Candidatus Nomurabacteria bacterium]